MAPKLYTFIESGNSYKVRLLASFLNVEVEEVEIDFLSGQHHSEEYLAISPRGTIPALVDGDKIFTDSAAMLVYLAGTHPDRGSNTTPSSYWSSDVVEQAMITDWLAFAASWIPLGVSKARGLLNFPQPNGESIEKTLADAKVKGNKSLEILEKKLEKEEWLALERVTIADLAVFVYIALAPMGDISLEPFPAVKKWIARIRNISGFIPIKGLDDPMYRRRGASST